MEEEGVGSKGIGPGVQRMCISQSFLEDSNPDQCTYPRCCLYITQIPPFQT